MTIITGVNIKNPDNFILSTLILRLLKVTAIPFELANTKPVKVIAIDAIGIIPSHIVWSAVKFLF